MNHQDEIKLITKEITAHKNSLVHAVTGRRPADDIKNLQYKIKIKESILSILKGDQDGVIE